MDSYMLVLILAMIWVSIGAYPFYKTWPKTIDYNTIIDVDDAYNGLPQLLNEQQNLKRQYPKSNRLSDLFYFRYEPTDMKDYDKWNNKLNDYYQYEYPTENDRDYNTLT
ncbi:unnamed protein product [Rotaria sp. Silwood1]|nr:unnamed protein product [Rotaria sp. Silwood1]CAF0941451.1 unnamed protein product [Rotaria sp. Silwood1]CAF3393093.1 unnamed protein product [Rotaria sp. Silwood1]CAF3394216.1 unnamed protein product [Rotaria sp. Silwood1]CAF4606813.1 unnamed protein product [Rotaria sp. Silwood1]